MAVKKTAVDPFKKFIKWFWILIASGIVAFLLMFLLASWGAFGPLPTFEELENPENNLATEVISSDGKTLGKYAKENRTPIKFKDLPANLLEALVATEDERYYEHSGIDFKSTLRAVVKLGKSGGGSTITQQLSKLLFHGEGSKNLPKRIQQKIKEYVISVRLERQYTKQEILAMYLNKYDFINGAVGIRSASRIYFGKEPIDLEIKESAMLVGMLKNSSLFNPLRREEMVLKRRNVVLKQMERSEFITTELKDSLQKTPLDLDIHKEGHSDGSATYFREYLRGFMKTWIKNHPKPDGTHYNLHRDGLKIFVTIDSRMQKYAEEAMQEHMSNLQRVFSKEQKHNRTAPFYDLTKEELKTNIMRSMKRSTRWRRMKKQGKSKKEILASFDKKTKMKVFSWKKDIDTIMSPKDSIYYYKHFLRAGLMSIEPQTGHVKAWVGGINYKHFQYDAVKQQKRQVGSTFKPFVYASAINQLKYSPCDSIPNTPFTIPKEKYGMDKDWTPKNATSKYGGYLTLKAALAGSVNVITARLIDEVGPSTVARLAHSAGIESKILAVPSIALGSVDLSLFEMVGAYSTFANKGLRVKQMMVLRIEDKNGTVLQEFIPETEEVLSEDMAYTVLNLLEGVTQGGSGVRLRSKWSIYPDKVVTGYPYQFTNPIAGKTGTTQNQSDGWFMGIVPNLASGVWVGGEDRAVHFKSIVQGQGATMALPIWAIYHKKLYADTELNISQEAFEVPENLSIRLNCDGTEEDIEEGDEDYDLEGSLQEEEEEEIEF
ncbi:MAG: penicillin-binding protein [Flavobacteriaceae bacterium]|nr:MAG: penicillin-binding protein [Flavobacteriaceae bacterium]